MPLDPTGKEAIEILNENVRRFKIFMNKLDNIDKENNEINYGVNDNDKEIEKIGCLKNMNNLISILIFYFFFHF
jgi:hypothetical protein